MINVSQLLNDFSDLLVHDSNHADYDIEVSALASINDYTSSDLIVCTNKNYLQQISEKKPAIVICDEDIAEAIPTDVCVFISNNPRLALALIKQSIDEYDATDSEWEHIHNSAVIHPSAKIHDSCRIGPKVVIGANAVIGKNSIIRSSSVIEHDVMIGQNCVIHSLVNIGYGSQIGNNVILRPGVIIANEGFGFAPDNKNKYHRIPHTGKVVIEDDVQIGSNSNVDRGTFGTTRIKQGCKIDSLCHIAHNVIIGENGILVSQTGIAGSTVIGDRVVISGQTGVLDHINITDDVTLVHRAGVTKDITENGVWAGLPLRRLKQHIGSYTIEERLLKKITKLEQRLKKLEEES